MTETTPTKLVCIGRNYAKHAAELGGVVPDEPLIFFKPPSSLIRTGEPIVIPDGVGRVDFEGEIAVVIGEPVRNVGCLLYTSPSPRDATLSRMPSSA